MENPTIEPLQEFAKSVIQKNIQGMYACEGEVFEIWFQFSIPYEGCIIDL